MTSDESFMKQAVKQAKKAYDKLETPIGCVIVHEDKIIARGYNKRNMKKNTLAHAEILAINKASKVLGDWRLEDCTMYVTLEPCPMCAGAILNARMGQVFYGARDRKMGACGGVFDCAGTDSARGDWQHESKSRMCRLRFESFAAGWIEPSGGGNKRCTCGGMQWIDDEFFQRTAKKEKSVMVFDIP